MGTAAVKIKVMPESPESNLQDLESKIKKILSENEAENPNFTTESVAFGLKAIVFTFGWPEEKELDTLEAALNTIEGVSSVQILDIRRAFG